MAFTIAELWALSSQFTEGFLSGGAPDERCCSSFAIPWKLILELIISGGITGGITYQITVGFTANRIKLEMKTKLNISINTIVDEINKALKDALLATGDAKAGEAAKLKEKVTYYIGPLLGFIGPVAAAVKALDDAAKGEVAQELVCTGFNCDKRSGGTVPNPPPPPPTPPPAGPTASAAAAGGAASASAAAGGQTIIITGGGSGGSSGTDSGMPSRRIPCDCGKGKLSDYVAPGKPTLTRRMTDKEKSDAARAAIEQFAGVWRTDAVSKQLHDVVAALSNVEPKKKRPLKASNVTVYSDHADIHSRSTKDRDH